MNTKSIQTAELSRRQARIREAPVPENVAKLHAAEAKMQELKANMAVLGKEAAAALAAVEAQQCRLTFQRLVAMVICISHLQNEFYFQFFLYVNYLHGYS